MKVEVQWLRGVSSLNFASLNLTNSTITIFYHQGRRRRIDDSYKVRRCRENYLSRIERIIELLSKSSYSKFLYLKIHKLFTYTKKNGVPE